MEDSLQLQHSTSEDISSKAHLRDDDTNLQFAIVTLRHIRNGFAHSKLLRVYGQLVLPKGHRHFALKNVNDTWYLSQLG